MKAVFLFDTTGYAAAPFTKRGWDTTIVDTQNIGALAENPRATHVLDWDILEREKELVSLCRGASFVFGFPPCTDLAASGARHFRNKSLDNPDFQLDAVELARSVERIADSANVAWALENPIGSLGTLWRRADRKFHPYEYGGYLPDDDEHPEYPKYILARDAYEKTTQIWHSFDFVWPPTNPVELVTITYSAQHHKLGGKSAKTKRIRSASPRGFFEGLARAYCNEL